jgi:LmbE family N-acetylglucosaminyl deacetylase
MRQLAFVQLITGRKEKAGEPPSRLASEPDAGPVVPIHSGETAGPPQNLSEAKPLTVSSDLKAELEARIADFRAHQERFNREREQYFSETLARLRAKIKDAPPPGPGK